MIRINFFGDFKVNNINQLTLGDNLKEEINSSNLNVINFEAPIITNDCKPIKKSGPNISQDTKSVDFLESNGFNVISLANNHMFDYGKEGLLTTKNSFKKAHTVGAGQCKDAYAPFIYNYNDIKIAIICLTQREFGALDDENINSYGTAWMLNNNVDKIISKTKQENDYVFIYVHAGIEDEFYPLPELRTLYKHYIDIGADAVIASHPHTPQGWEEYNNKMIFYSLGNFCFETTEPSNNFWNNSLLISFFIDNYNLQYKVTNLYYNSSKSLIETTEEEYFTKHIKQINLNLTDNEKYINEVNQYCKKLSQFYIWSIESTGLIQPTIRQHIKGLINIILKRKKYITNIHLLNTFRCEVHRWCFSRYLNNQIVNYE